MQEDPLPAILFIFALILAKGFFSLIYAAFLSSRKTWLMARIFEGDSRYKIVLDAVENPSRVRSALQTARVFLGTAAGAAAGAALAHIFLRPPLGGGTGETARFALVPWGAGAVLCITAAQVVLGDVIPKALARAGPERITVGAFPVITALSALCKPLTLLSAGLSSCLARLLRIEQTAPQGMTEGELRMALKEGEKSGVVATTERTMVEGVFYLGDRPVGTFMTHRSEIVWLDAGSDAGAMRDAVFAHREQRYFPVAAGNLDEVIGVVSVEDLLFGLLDERGPGLGDITRPCSFVPETMSALKAFESFRNGKAEFLLVMDEYGGLAGALSLRNLVEEIVGQLSAPAQDEVPILKQDDGTFLVDGSVNIDEIAEVLGLSLGEHQEYHTLAGFLLSMAGEIPRTGACFEYGGCCFKVLDMDGNRIDKVFITPPAAPPAAEAQKRHAERGP
ncbi:MAG: hemolysin family protein [Spirochaetaceae bacterium]|jgi:putative hemolysin|nr:hemolysin family protein [Spirochaetaceae bacterium]